MRKTTLKSADGTPVPCICANNGSNIAVIVSHFFSESKESGLNRMIFDRLDSLGISWVSFDMRGHGDSIDSGITLEYATFCEDLEAAERYAVKKMKASTVKYIGEGLSAVIMLYWLSLKNRYGKDLLLINPDIDIYNYIESGVISDEDLKKIEAGGSFETRFPDSRQFEVSEFLLDDISFLDMMGLYRRGSSNTVIIASEHSDVTDLNTIKRFSFISSSELITIPSKDHFMRDCGEDLLNAVSSFAVR